MTWKRHLGNCRWSCGLPQFNCRTPPQRQLSGRQTRRSGGIHHVAECYKAAEISAVTHRPLPPGHSGGKEATAVSSHQSRLLPSREKLCASVSGGAGAKRAEEGITQPTRNTAISRVTTEHRLGYIWTIGKQGPVRNGIWINVESG